jgi:uncharacterized protein
MVLSKNIIITKLRKNQDLLKNFGINQVGLFGSYQREEANKNSDIDILIDFEEGQETFDNYMNFCFFLENLFKSKQVEVVSKKGLSPYIAPYILNEVEYA